MASAELGQGRGERPPTDGQIAEAYLRIAHIYRGGGILHLAADYYDLVVARFAAHPRLAGRARLWRARCLAGSGRHAPARRLLRAVVRDPAASDALRCHAGLRLLRIVAHGYGRGDVREARRLLVRRLRSRIPARRLARWVGLADAMERQSDGKRSVVAES